MQELNTPTHIAQACFSTYHKHVSTNICTMLAQQNQFSGAQKHRAGGNLATVWKTCSEKAIATMKRNNTSRSQRALAQQKKLPPKHHTQHPPGRIQQITRMAQNAKKTSCHVKHRSNSKSSAQHRSRGTQQSETQT